MPTQTARQSLLIDLVVYMIEEIDWNLI